MPFVSFEFLKSRISMLQVLACVGWQAIRWTVTGPRGPCPLHVSRNAYSTVFAATEKGFFCHKCKLNGDIITFWAEYQACDKNQAAQDLLMKFCLEEEHEKYLRRDMMRQIENGEEER